MKITDFQNKADAREEDKIEWLAGVILGDGRVSDRYVRVYSNTPEITQKSKEIFKSDFGIQEDKIKTRILQKERSGYKRSKETIELCINSKEFAEKFKKLIQQFVENPTASFVRGLFDAEGSVDLAGNITLWQRKNSQGNIVSKTVKNFLDSGTINYKTINNTDFHIIEIQGRYKNLKNLIRFSEILGFSICHKQRDLETILEIYSKKTMITEKEILDFLSRKGEGTLRDIIVTFRIPKINAYRILNILVTKRKLNKTKSYPNIYKLR